MNRFLLCAFLLGPACEVDGRKCDGLHNCETQYERDLRQQVRVLEDRTLLLQEKLSELDRCLFNHMTIVEDVFQLKVSIQTCVTVMRNVRGLTP